MTNYGLIIGSGILLFSFIYMLFKLSANNKADGNNKHFLLQMLIFLFIFIMVLIVGKASYDAGQNCEWLQTNVSVIYKYGNNFTGYHWDYDTADAPNFNNPNDPASVFLFHRWDEPTWEYLCDGTDSNTDDVFYKFTAWFSYIGLLYVFLYFVYEVLVLLNWVVPKEKGSRNKEDYGGKRGNE